MCIRDRRYGGQRVGNIVDAGNHQLYAALENAVFIQVKGTVCQFIKSGIAIGISTIRRGTISNDLTGKPICDLPEAFDLPIDDQGTVVRKPSGKFPERAADIFQIFKEIQMICFYI